MKAASIDKDLPSVEVDVLLDVGREGLSFTYLDRKNLEVDVNDIVQVRLKGRKMHGLVIQVRKCLSTHVLGEGKVKLADIESIVQKSAVDLDWRDWMKDISVKCHTSFSRMIKAALPPGWIGKVNSRSTSPRKNWWVFLNIKTSDLKDMTSRQSELKAYLMKLGGGAWQKDLQNKGFSSAVLKSMILNGYAERELRENIKEISSSIELEAFENDRQESHNLTKEQQSAIDKYISMPKGATLLLWGVTGSGKTEVYLQLVAKELAEGNHCLILAPEIGLIPQLVDRCRRRFGPLVLEYHSSCSSHERTNTWRAGISSDKPLVVVGTRSSIFIPLSPLGLIVLDEEHDSSYKQDSPMPCYHARELAIDRAKKCGAKVVLGSATPSLVTWKCLTPRGDILLTKLTRRISENPLPKVDVVDMRKELAEGHRRLISRKLMDCLIDLPKKREQAVILVPRRGYSSFLSCRSCGGVVECPNCDVALTVHKGSNGRHWLRCHWCDYRTKVESQCKQCGSTAFKPFGAGTQRVMEYLAEELEGLRLLRFDRDTTGGRDGHRKLLEEFASGGADVLIGTQMLAKGMDLPRVTLAVVLAADGLLHRPDLHASEQSLQLFMQLAGRAGRGELPGYVLVQTYCPDHPVIAHLVDGSYEAFLKQEAELRSASGLVPFRRACLLRLSGELNSLTATTATTLAERIKPLCNSKSWSLLGPAPSLVARVAGKCRWQILIHGPEGSPLPLPKGSELWNDIPKGVNLSVDPDPIQL